MSTLEAALEAKTRLRERLGRPPWLRGIGVAEEPGKGFVVQVNVDAVSADVRAAVPERLRGVPVRTEQVGRVRAVVRARRSRT